MSCKKTNYGSSYCHIIRKILSINFLEIDNMTNHHIEPVVGVGRIGENREDEIGIADSTFDEDLGLLCRAFSSHFLCDFWEGRDCRCTHISDVKIWQEEIITQTRDINRSC